MHSAQRANPAELLTLWLDRRRDLDLSQAFERPVRKLAPVKDRIDWTI
jgi:hypothetical protein